MDFYEAWWYLEEHEYYQYKFFEDQKYSNSCFVQSLDIHIAKVNPKTNRIDNDDSRNTKVQVWLETGDWDYEHKVTTHDHRLDCGGDTFEDAIIELASLVKGLKNN